ncbi:MAG: hypothetical protein JSS04_10400 [Proteobacteria bacterium]|nr:hypothetical protein [Pseudomonadota bacterium]
MRELLAQRLGQHGQRLEGDDVAGMAAHVVDIGAVVGADIDRVGIAPAQEL